MEADTRFGEGNATYLGRGNFVQHGPVGGAQVVPQGEFLRRRHSLQQERTILAPAKRSRNADGDTHLSHTGQQQSYGSI